MAAKIILFLFVFALHLPASNALAYRALQHGRLRMSSPYIDASSINYKLDNIKNMRDVSTAVSGRIKPAKIFRTGCVSKASDSDKKCVLGELGVKTLIDLRSPAELHEDEDINSDVYKGFQNFNYDKKTMSFVPDSSTDALSSSGKKRYFISLMSESLIKKGVFFRLRKRLRVFSVLLFIFSNFSRRADKKVRKIFIDTINGGGLSLLNELVVDFSSKEIIQVLKLLSTKENHPVAMYCTAGKDRTGLITMLVLSVLGASREEILADYVLSDKAYSEINDKKAMVASLKQVDVDPEIFLRAKPQVMSDTIDYVTKTFGSVDSFLDKNGFDATWREALKSAML